MQKLARSRNERAEVEYIATEYNKAIQFLIASGTTIRECYIFNPKAPRDPDYYGKPRDLDGEMMKAQALVLSVNYCLAIMMPSYQMVLWSDFFKRGDRGWYLGYFSRSAYYRIRRRSIKAFLKAYYDVE